MLIIIWFPITWQCNLKCANCCAIKNLDEPLEPRMEKLREKIGEVEWVFITGGEPFMVDNLIEICDEIKAMQFKVGITTNGTIHRPEVAYHVDRIGISIDGDREYHDAYRGEGNFDKSIAFYNMIKEVDGCETVIMSVAFKDNIDALKKLKPIVEDLDPDYWQIQRDYFDSTVVIDEQLTL